jgi:hypothetical protein
MIFVSSAYVTGTPRLLQQADERAGFVGLGIAAAIGLKAFGLL